MNDQDLIQANQIAIMRALAVLLVQNGGHAVAASHSAILTRQADETAQRLAARLQPLAPSSFVNKGGI